MRRGRIAVALSFLSFGVALGMWFAHLPLIVQRLDVSPGLLGIVLLCIGLSGLVTQPIAGLAVTRFGARPVQMILLPATMVANLLAILSPSVPLLVVFAILLGGLAVPANVSSNTLAAEYEGLRGRPTMSFFHGCFSLGGLIGSLLGGLLINAGLGDGRGALGVDIVLFAVTVWACMNVLGGRPRPAQAGAPKAPRFALPAISIVGLCAIAAVCNTVEGSVGDWSAIYLTTVKNSGPALATTGYAMFSVAMTVLRFAGGPIIERLGNRALVIGGGALIAIGMLIVVLAPWPLVSALGYLVVAIGAANNSPIFVSAAANTPGVAPAMGVAAVGTSLTIGFLSGPPIIGFIAQAWGLSLGLGFVVVLGAVVALGGSAWRWTPVPAASRA
jgi:MFS family permease